MTTNELERLIAMLEPSADADAVDYVRQELIKACVPKKKLTTVDDWGRIVKDPPARTDQQSTDPFGEWLPNDPRFW